MTDDLTTQRDAMLGRMAQAMPSNVNPFYEKVSLIATCARLALTELSMDSALSESEERALLAMRDAMTDATAAKLWRLMR